MIKEHEEQLLKIAEEQLNSATLGLLGQLIKDHNDLREKYARLLKANSEYESALDDANIAAKKHEQEKQDIESSKRSLEQLRLDLTVRETAISKRELEVDLHDAKEEIKHLKDFNEKLNSYNATLFANKSIHQMISFNGSFPVPTHYGNSYGGVDSCVEQHQFDGNAIKTKE